MKSYSLLIISLIFSFNGLTQNFIYNGSFENGDLISAQSMVQKDLRTDYLDDWERGQGAKCYHSPDWWHDDPINGFEAPEYNNARDEEDLTYLTPPVIYPFFGPHEGGAMLGMSSYELIQQKYDHDGLMSTIIGGSSNPLITLRICIRSSNAIPPNSHVFKVFLASEKVRYKENSGCPEDDDDPLPISTFCTDDHRSYQSGMDTYPIIDINNVGTIYPRGDWYVIEKTFVPPPNIALLDWIVIDLHQELCSREYLFIDNVQMFAEKCDDLCSKTDGELFNEIPGNTINSVYPFTVENLGNVSSARLEIFATTGGLTVVDETIYCLNGFEDDLIWDGTDEFGNQVANGVYGYKLTTYNDCNYKELQGKLLKIEDYTGPLATNFSSPCVLDDNLTPEPCCPFAPDLFVDNENLMGPGLEWSQFIIEENIWVSTSEPDFSDQVLIENDAKVLYRAGNQITLREGFNTADGAVFCAEIEPCDRPRPDNKMAKIPEVPKAGNINLSVFPNPTTGLTTLQLENFNPIMNYQVAIISSVGKTVKTFNMTTNQMDIDLSDIANGIYTITVYNGTEFKSSRIIKQ